MRTAALTDNGIVVNTIVIGDDFTATTWDGLPLDVLPAGSPVGPGWRHDGNGYTPPPTRSLTVDRASIPADGSTAAVVTYADTFDNPPASVTFTVNGATQTVTTAAGVATLEVTSSTAGDTVVVSVDALPGVTLTINVEG